MIKLCYFHILLSLFSIIIIHVSSSSSSSSLLSNDPTLPLLSLRFKSNQNSGSRCTFRVEISTTCSSVSNTRDQISISFGDAYGNQVYVPRIDNPSSRAFEACSTDTYDINGPCTYDVCYIYLYRRGNDGLMVKNVRISNPNIRTATFNYNVWIPRDVWYGFNYCNGAHASLLM